jgi:hypothetical protein
MTDPFANMIFDTSDDPGSDFGPEPAAAAPRIVGLPIEDFIQSVESKRWSVGGLVIEGGITVLAGDPESFKSTGAHNIAMHYCRAWEGEWMGLPVEEGPVVYLSNEKAATSLRDRFKAMLDDDVPQHPFIVTHNKARVSATPAPGHVPWSDVVDMIRDLHATSGKSVLLIVDTLTSCGPIGYDENDNRQVSEYLDQLKHARDAGATILLLHHYSKNGSANGGGAMALRGGTALAGDIDGSGQFHRPDQEQARGTLRLRPKEGVHSSTGFVVDAGGTFRMTPAEAQVVLLTADMVAQAVKDGATSQGAVYEACKAQVNGVTKAQVADKVKELVAAGLLVKTGRNKALSIKEQE